VSERATPSTGLANLGTPLLVDLVTNTLDPGYAEATERRQHSPGPHGRWYDRPVLVIGCVLIGFTLVVAYLHAHRSAPAEAKATAELVKRVRTAQSTANGLQRSADDLDARVKQQRDSALSGAGGGLGVAVNSAETQAGEDAVKGPGVMVTLTDPPTPTASPAAGRAGTTPLSATHILTDRDVRSVVNELWADGAEAISVNNIRLTSTSAIRFAGQAVLVDFDPIIGPYQIRAIGPSGQLLTRFVQSDVASRYQTLSSAEGIGFSFDQSSKLELPASQPPTLRYAHPLAAQPSTPSPTGSGSNGGSPGSGPAKAPR
jgi:uncharacterized protein YlxW (UPF0749 family)